MTFLRYNNYTSIPHDSLKNNMNILIDEAFKVRGAQYLSCNNKMNCYWTQSRSSNISIDKTELKAMVEYLVSNVFVQVGNKIFRQQVGIPMGTDCAPLLANLYLFYYEYLYMKNLIKSNFGVAKRFSHTLRYIDDLLTLNNPSLRQK